MATLRNFCETDRPLFLNHLPRAVYIHRLLLLLSVWISVWISVSVTSVSIYVWISVWNVAAIFVLISVWSVVAIAVLFFFLLCLLWIDVLIVWLEYMRILTLF
jgi:hypothetical protein